MLIVLVEKFHLLCSFSSGVKFQLRLLIKKNFILAADEINKDKVRQTSLVKD